MSREYNGIILIDKPLNRTSHDMVYEVRRLTGVKKVGHTGTLDPMAGGVLPVCVGTATKAADLLTMSDKEYRAQLVLGMTTDTQDAEGEVLTECGVSCTREEIEDAVMSFVGEIEQIPPMYSAIKQNGRKLYELARAGITVERPVRRVTIRYINIEEIDMEKGTVTFLVGCTKGAYIRTLCEDIGYRLKTGGYMNTLTRTRSGPFQLEQCYSLWELYALRECGRLFEALIAPDALFSEYEPIRLNQNQTRRIKNGVPTTISGIREGREYRVYDENERFFCLCRGQEGRLTLIKSFW